MTTTIDAPATEAATFGALLTEARQAAGLTMAQLAVACGYDTSYVSKLESGSRLPHRETVVAIAVHLTLDEATRDRLLLAANCAPDGPAAALAAEHPEMAHIASRLAALSRPARRQWLALLGELADQIAAVATGEEQP